MPTPTTVATLMTTEVFAVASHTSLEVAARLLCDKHIGGAPVVDHHGKVVGVVTQADLLSPDRDFTPKVGGSLYYKIGHEGPVPMQGQPVRSLGIVADVMTPFVLSVSPQTPVADAARLMIEENVHRLLVTKNGKLVGLISSTDLLRTIAA